MNSMMDVIKRYNPIKIQQFFENEHVVLRNIPMTYCSGFDKLLQILIPDDHANRLLFNYMGLKFHHIIYSDIILVLKFSFIFPGTRCCMYS
jgi:hypothetical protein